MAMREVKVELPPSRVLVKADKDSMSSLDAIVGRGFTTLPPMAADPDRCFAVTNADGTITLVAETVSINGIQFFIPADQATRVPILVAEHLFAAENNRNLLPMPQNNLCIG